MEVCLLNTQYMMSCSEKKDAPFAYESSLHSRNLLSRLNSQREQDILCDVTVVVEDQRFRAHRAVLAACSDYFLSRVVHPCDGDFVITLPDEVTIKGFGPLLQFAYTSKLVVNKDNLSEIRKSAKILEVHDIEETCFQFLKLKYLDNKTEPQECPRKKCCKSFCPKANIQRQQESAANLEVNEVEELWREEFPQNLKIAPEIENTPPISGSPKKLCETFCFGGGNVSDISSLCPKYRKFQKAFKSDRIRTVSSCSSNQDVQSPASVQSSDTSENVILPRTQGSTDIQLLDRTGNQMEGSELTSHDSSVTYCNPTEEKARAKLIFPSCFSLGSHDYNNSVPFTCAYQPYKNLNCIETQSSSNIPATTEKITPVNEQRNTNLVSESPCPSLVTESSLGVSQQPLLTRERSNVEREVAEHLAKGFWTDIYNNEFPCPSEIEMVPTKEPPEENNTEKRPECPWLGISISENSERTFTTLNSVSCPFISTISGEGCANNSEISNEECDQGKESEKCPYACSIDLEEESETDSDEDSVESCSAKEQELEKKLPFNAQKIISLSRYDFQSLVKMHNLTPEQLDCIHDIRRRSKNRIAAQRCRKRKLDCIQNLEYEIEKLENEKEHLLKERDQILSTLGETKQNLSGLCQQVCREAALSREQIQILAKYSSSECPLSFLISEKDKMLLQCESLLQASQGYAEGLPNVGAAPQGVECNTEYKLLQNMAEPSPHLK
ncbi:transcription regulator protein BACH1 isoform 2-T2 [Discoglossus pictus]